ncbi:MAG: sulfotransferase [Planctomycetaceae bacterium]|nr:sulfotransferase [Planctomycetales bacterium]MCB9940733.1 sulfotransferase [Planctomycetaceae bacterium]
MTEKKQKADGGARDMPWEPRVWNGMRVKTWFNLLARNRFRVSPTRVPMALLNTGITLFNSALAWQQQLFFGRKIAECKLADDPIFILGHWRTGTTWLHELMVLDERHAFPTTYECLAPSHFLFSEALTSWWLWMLMPRKRPMDNVRIGLDSPQEDELALAALGAHSPYLTWAFPNHPPQDQEYLDLRDVSPEDLASWKASFDWFLRALQVKNPDKRIVLKSPTHSYRVPVLLDMFPNARFVYLVRDPYVVFPSMMKTWKRLHQYHGAQAPKHVGLEEYVFQNFEHLHRVFEEDRELIAPERLCVLRYEDLVQAPVEQMNRIYDNLDLGKFENVKPQLEKFVSGMSGYVPNRHNLPADLHDQIARRCAGYIEKYGYSTEAPTPT